MSRSKARHDQARSHTDISISPEILKFLPSFAFTPLKVGFGGRGGADAMSTVAAVFVLRDDGAALLQHRDDSPRFARRRQVGAAGGHLMTAIPCRMCPA